MERRQANAYAALEELMKKKRDEVLDKAGAACDKAIEKLDKIREYYEEHNIQHKEGGRWDWEKTLQDASRLKYDIVNNSLEFTGI